MTRQSSCRLKSILGIVVASGLGGSPALAGDGNSILKQLKNISTISSTVPSNGDVTLGIYRVRANVDPRIIGVQEIPSLGVFLLDTADDHDVGFDLAVRMEHRFAAAPAFLRPNVFVDAELCHRNSSEGPILRGRFSFLQFEEFLRKCLRKESNPLKQSYGGEGGIRTPGRGFGPTTV